MAPRVKTTDLTDAEEVYLRSCIANYRSTPSTEKEDFRENCARYIMRQRSLEENVYIFDLFLGKVRNWFQNHAQKSKTARLPVRINQGFSAQRVFALKNEDLIRQGVGERKEEAAGEDLPHLATWNETARQLWKDLPIEEKRVFERLAEKWAAEGPEEAVKPVLAEKRAPSWMRSVANLFWTQCNMPIFIYGMYKDKDGAVHAAVYDTSNLWRESDKTAPLLRNIPGWDQDFRRVAWNFFQAALRPDLAAPETLQLMKASKRQPPAPVQFALNPDGCPILVNEENGKGLTNARRQELFREYIKTHYSREMRSAPWGSMRECPSKFFQDGTLPEGFMFHDPSKINEGALGRFFDHVIQMETPPDANVLPRQFRFHQYEMGAGDNRTYHPAVYNGTVELAAPGRGKKAVTVPAFEDPPSPADGSSSLGSRGSKSPLPDLPPVVSPLGAALLADFEAVRAEMQAEAAVGTGANSSDATTVAASDTARPIATKRPKRAAAKPPPSQPASSIPWLDAEIDVAGQQSDAESDLTEDSYVPDTGDHHDASDEEVEDFLIDDLASEVESLAAEPQRSSPSAVFASTLVASRAVDGTVGAAAPAVNARPLAPMEVPADAGARLTYLESLASDAEYVALLQRVDGGLRSVTTVRAQNPVFWGTWGHKSPHVPEAVQTIEKKTAQLLQWIARAREETANAADVQHFCLIVGISLRDLTLLASTDGTTIWPDEVPGFMARSSLDASHRGEILKACEVAFTEASTAAVGPAKNKKGKGKAVMRTGGRAAKGDAAVVSEVFDAPPANRRSSRAAARRT
ncbi:hypothetical protein LXA43DRAFT_1065080 [Ganoderma leucocontextum]|nr:hypothetical protein LXA43DRAFT_1065080 [Ganoderma leucocontextum]